MFLELAPCPACKSKPTVYAARFTRDGTQHAIGCTKSKCGVSTTFTNESFEQLARRWNNGIGLYRSNEPVSKITNRGQLMMVEFDDEG